MYLNVRRHMAALVLNGLSGLNSETVKVL